MPIVITSKRDGFRRCGKAHPARAVEHADDAFTPAQLKQLKADPMLVVQAVEQDEDAGGKSAKQKKDGK